MGGSEDVLSFVRSNWVRLAFLGLALLLSIIGAGLASDNNANGLNSNYDKVWTVLSIVILIVSLYLDGRVVLFYLVLGFIYAVLPQWIVLSNTNNASHDDPHAGAALLSASLFFALFALTPSDGWQQFRTNFLGGPVGWFALVVFVLNFFGCLLIWIAVGKNDSAHRGDNGLPLAYSIIAFLNGLLFLIAYAYKYAHASLLGFLVFTEAGILLLEIMVTTGLYSDLARAGAGFTCFPNFVFIFIIWRVCVAPLSVAQQSHDANAAPAANVSGANVDAPQGGTQPSAPPAAQGWRATIFSSLVRFAGLCGCLAVAIIGLLIIRDTQAQAVIEIAAAVAVGLLLVTLFFPTWDYSFIFIYIGIFLVSIPIFVYQRSNHDALNDGRSSSEIDSGLVFIITATVVAYFIREFSVQRIQRFTLGRDLLWLYVVGIVAELVFIIGLIILFSEADKYHGDATVSNVTVPLVLLLVYFFIQLHLDADLSHRLVLLFLTSFFLEADLSAASTSNGASDNEYALRRAGCALCAIGLYAWQFVLCFLHWNETNTPSAIKSEAGPTAQPSASVPDDHSGGASNAGAAIGGGAGAGGMVSNPYQQQVDYTPHNDEQTHSEAPVQTV